MSRSSNTVPFESGDESHDDSDIDSTCPECGTESIVSYLDKYSSYEYCTHCEWTDEDDGSMIVEPISRQDRWREGA